MFDEEEHRKKMSFFRQILRFQEAVNGVFVQRIMANDLRRLLDDPDSDDPVAQALSQLDTIFRHCTTELGPADGGAVSSSVETVVEETRDDKANGENGEGCVLLVWKMEHTDGKHFAEPELVGIATLFRMKATAGFSTDSGSFNSPHQYSVLTPYFRGQNTHTVNEGRSFPDGLGIKGKYMYLDVVCSKQKGIGRLLILHAYRYAIMKKTKGLLALSFSKRALNAQRSPASYKIFQELGFETIIRNTNYRTAMYGHWVAKSTHNITFKGVIESLGDVCTRSGYTSATSNKLMWRCPM